MAWRKGRGSLGACYVDVGSQSRQGGTLVRVEQMTPIKTYNARDYTPLEVVF